jgi:hypothetical protein
MIRRGVPDRPIAINSEKSRSRTPRTKAGSFDARWFRSIRNHGCKTVPGMEPPPRHRIRPNRQSPVLIVSGIGHNDVGSVAFPLGIRGHDDADTSADADLHTLSDYHRDAVHQMRDADAAGLDRAARPEFRSAHLSVRPVRRRREFFAGVVDRQWPDEARYAPSRSCARACVRRGQKAGRCRLDPRAAEGRSHHRCGKDAALARRARPDHRFGAHRRTS